jgi:signal transduction histidine kinase
LAAAIVVLLGVVTVLAGRARRASERLREVERHADDLAERLRAAEIALTSAETVAVEREQLAAIGELSAMIAHEIRNPLTIIGNAIATLRRRETSPEDRSTLLGILEEEAARLNRFMSDLLSYARPVSLELVPVDVREIVERALGLVPERAALEVELIEPEPAGRVMGDANLLRQVFENLVNNSAQAMGREGGILTVRILRREEKGSAGVDVFVEDTGEGMDTSVRDRALLPFFTTRPSGTGLGLAIVARFVQAHGGKLEIRSAAGKGTSVRVFLPSEETSLKDVGKSHPRMKQSAALARGAVTGS